MYLYNKNENGKLAYHKCLPSELKNIKDFNEFDYAEFDWKKVGFW